MNDTMNPIVQHSPFPGQLILEQVKGTVSGRINPENDVVTAVGSDRDMFEYIPVSGCPHAKQTQVLMVLRNKNDQESAEQLMSSLKLDELAEAHHFVLLFPNPLDSGWNVQDSDDSDNDIQFLVRCFACLKKSKSATAGFNGMIYYLGTDPVSSAMAMTLAVKSPLDAAAIMIGAFPDGYQIPKGDQAQQVAWIYEDCNDATNYLKKVDCCETYIETNHVRAYTDAEDSNVHFYSTHNGLNAYELAQAWDWMFSETRRWRNDVFGIYQKRLNFSEEGFVKHYQDDMLGINNGFKHTWYEFIPEGLRGTQEKVPLVIYLHGINCVALYGAEQSGWSELAKQNGFIAVFPDPAIEERWNIWDDPRLPSDVSYIMALIKHMNEVHPIDESRIYVSGFSMGSMFTNALACSYPEVFAGALALNGPNQGYLNTLDQSRDGMLMFRPDSILRDIPFTNDAVSPVHLLADEEKNAKDLQMPFVQCVGLLDGVGFTGKNIWPLTQDKKSLWNETIKYWQNYNHLTEYDDPYDPEELSGLKSDRSWIDGRFTIQEWEPVNKNSFCTYRLICASRMPHAVDWREIELGWKYISQFRREKDGTIRRVSDE